MLPDTSLRKALVRSGIDHLDTRNLTRSRIRSWEPWKIGRLKLKDAPSSSASAARSASSTIWCWTPFPLWCLVCQSHCNCRTSIIPFIFRLMSLIPSFNVWTISAQIVCLSAAFFSVVLMLCCRLDILSNITPRKALKSSLCIGSTAVVPREGMWCNGPASNASWRDLMGDEPVCDGLRWGLGEWGKLVSRAVQQV